MKQIEQNLKNWLKATDQPAPSKFDLQQMRALEVVPVHVCLNLWRCESTSRAGVVYEQEVFFAGMDEAAMLGYALRITCTCPATGKCVHSIAIERKFNSNWQYYFHLFNLPTDSRMSDLHQAATETDARLRNFNARLAA